MKHLFLLLGFLLAAFTAQAATQKGVKPDDDAGLYYNLYDDGTAEIVRNPDNSSTYSMASLTIPATVTYNDMTYNVTTIATNAFLNSTIQSISGGAKITTIGGTVFGSNSTLTSINLDGKVTSIGSNAFDGCARLTSIGNILDNVTEIPYKVFYGCTALTGTITITAPITSIGEDVFNGCTDSNLSVSFTNLTDAVISQRAFYEFTGLKSVAGTVKSIGNIAFSRCTNFEKLELYNTTTPPTLGSDVFKNSLNLTVYVHPDIKESYQAADGWKDLSPQPLPEEVYYNVTPADGNGLKYNLNTLGARGTAQVSDQGTCDNEVVIPAKITYDGKTCDVTGISDHAFSKTSITSVSSGDNITSIGVSAFQECSYLTSIGHLLDNVTDIPSTAFDGCSSLTGEITLNAAITNIGNYAFYNCTNQNLSLSFTNLTNATIGEGAFSNSNPYGDCTGLKSIAGTAKSIGKNAFYECSKLTSIGHLLDNVTAIPSYAFYSCSALTGTITLNAAITNIDESAFNGCSNERLSLSISNLTNAAIGNSAFFNCTGLKSIGGTAASIGVSAFKDCYNLTSIGNLLDNVTDIPDYAFFNCSALPGNITLNAGINNIGEYAFIDSGISNIYCLAAMPPHLGDLALGENARSVKVPSSAVSYYESEWSSEMTISAGDPKSATTAANSGSTTHWATFSNTYSDSKLSVEAGKTLTLYNATVADGKLTLTERTGSSVAKGEAVLVKTDAVTVRVTSLATTELDKAKDNDLLATPEYATILHSQDGCKYYRLTYNNATYETGLGFYLGVATVDGVKKTDGTYLNASPYKAYLKVTVEAATEPSTAKLARGFAFPGDDGETTGIECITVTDEGTGNNWVEGIFDLQGRKVSKPTKGVYINNGKKVIIK